MDKIRKQILDKLPKFNKFKCDCSKPNCFQRVIIDADLAALKKLLQSGKDVNSRRNASKDTALHLSIEHNRREIFDFLLTLPEIQVDLQRYDGKTALNYACYTGRKYYIGQLIRKGADVNLADDNGDTPLHFSNWVEICRELIENGADVDVLNKKEESPLFRACLHQLFDVVLLLLYYGADPFLLNVPGRGPFFYLFTCGSEELIDILFLYLFDEVGIEMTVLDLAMLLLGNFEFFWDILGCLSKISIDEQDLRFFVGKIPDFDCDKVVALLRKCPEFAEDLFAVFDPVVAYTEWPGCQRFDLVEMLYALDGLAIRQFCQSYDALSDPEVAEISIVFALEQAALFRIVCCDARKGLVKKHFSEAKLIKIVSFLLSHGLYVTTAELEAAYDLFGFGPLFELLLHMEIVDLATCPKYATLLPELIYNPAIDVYNSPYFETRLDPENYEACELVCRFFVHPFLRRGAWQLFGADLAKVPSLVELSRQAARKHLINRFQIKNNVGFFTLLKALPIGQMNKDIICYKQELYQPKFCYVPRTDAALAANDFVYHHIW